LSRKEGVISIGNVRVVVLTGEYIDSYAVPERWASLIQRDSFKVLFKDPSALKTKDGTYLLNPFHLNKRFPAEKIPQEVIMAGAVRLEAWRPIL
jgi:hypothetical protein